jgi:hypothetical protein
MQIMINTAKLQYGLQYCSIAVLQYCSFAVLQFCSIAVLQFCSFAVNTAILQN